MTIFRFKTGLMGLLLITQGCAQKQRTISEILARDQEGPDLLGAFNYRLDELSADAKRARAEFAAAGFEVKSVWRNCGTWEYPKGKNGIFAFAQFCELQNGSVEFGRVGITRDGPMEYHD